MAALSVALAAFVIIGPIASDASAVMPPANPHRLPEIGSAGLLDQREQVCDMSSPVSPHPRTTSSSPGAGADPTATEADRAHQLIICRQWGRLRRDRRSNGAGQARPQTDGILEKASKTRQGPDSTGNKLTAGDSREDVAKNRGARPPQSLDLSCNA